jgi:hypothetical protein
MNYTAATPKELAKEIAAAFDRGEIDRKVSASAVGKAMTRSRSHSKEQRNNLLLAMMKMLKALQKSHDHEKVISQFDTAWRDVLDWCREHAVNCISYCFDDLAFFELNSLGFKNKAHATVNSLRWLAPTTDFAKGFCLICGNGLISAPADNAMNQQRRQGKAKPLVRYVQDTAMLPASARRKAETSNIFRKRKELHSSIESLTATFPDPDEEPWRIDFIAEPANTVKALKKSYQQEYGTDKPTVHSTVLRFLQAAVPPPLAKTSQNLAKTLQKPRKTSQNLAKTVFKPERERKLAGTSEVPSPVVGTPRRRVWPPRPP